MRKLLLSLAALSLAVPVSMTLPTTKAEAKKRYYGHSRRHVRTCRHSSGTTGLVAGGVGGAFAGRAIDRTITAKNRCR